MHHTTAIRRLHLHAVHVGDGAGDLTAVLRGLLAQLDPLDGGALVRHAYWRMPEIATDALVGAVGGPEVLRCLAGRGPLLGSCPGCGRGIRAVGRDDADAADPPGPCAACRRPHGAAVRGGGGRPGRPRRRLPVVDAPPVSASPGAVRRWAEDYPVLPGR